jgi:hypothetical protein
MTGVEVADHCITCFESSIPSLDASSMRKVLHEPVKPSGQDAPMQPAPTSGS